MADQPTTDLVVEGGKHVASGGAGMIALAFIQRFFKKQEVDDEREAKALEAVLAELKTINAGVSDVKASLGILTERVSNTRADMDEIKDEHKQLLDRLSRLEGKFDHLSEQLAK